MGSLGDLAVTAERVTWLCPGVGLVKVRREITKIDPRLGAYPAKIMTMQLTSTSLSE